MFKIIFLVVGLAAGFAGGVYWGQKNPEKAAQLSAEEEKRFLEAQLAITQKIQAKLDQLQNKTAAAPASPGAPGSGFVSAGQGGSSTATAADVRDVKADAQKQQDELEKHLAKLK